MGTANTNTPEDTLHITDDTVTAFSLPSPTYLHRCFLLWLFLYCVSARNTFFDAVLSFFFLRFYLFIFRERGKEGERERETSMYDSLSLGPQRRPGLQPRHVPWLGIEPAILWFTARAQSTELHQPGLFLFDWWNNYSIGVSTVIFFQCVSAWARRWFITGCNSRLPDQKCNSVSVIKDLSLLIQNVLIPSGSFPSFPGPDLVPNIGLCHSVAVTWSLSYPFSQVPGSSGACAAKYFLQL